jgi:glycosyltransferase involved in cell wall biosynthesis
MARQIRLLILVKSIDGGTGTFLLNLLEIKKIFKDKSFSVKTLVLERPSYRKIVNFKFDYFRKKDFYPQRYSLSPLNFLNFFKEIAWITEKVQSFRPTLILSVDLRCNLLAIFLKILSLGKIKVIATNHIDLSQTISDKSTKLVRSLLIRAIQIFYDFADAIVSVSKSLSSSLKKDFHLKSKVLTVYNGQDFNFQKPKRLPRTGHKTILTIARLVEQKDHLTLIKAFGLLSKDLPGTTLWIASNGPLKRRLETSVKRLGLTESIKFLGWVKDTNAYLKKADIFVLSSKREGFGYVLIEAMSQGIPVVSTDCPYGPGEVLAQGKYGLLTPPRNFKSLKSAMLELLTNAKKYDHFAKMAVKRSKFFTREKMLKGYKKIIIRLS